VREHRVPLEVCIVVDNSYSLQADRMVEKAKGLAFGLLEDAVGKRDRVSLVAFKSGIPEATVALRPTSSVRVAATRLRDVPLSGRTPLADALRLAGTLLRQEGAKRPNARPVLVVVSDGLPNVPRRRGGDPVADALAEARVLRRRGVRLVVVDAIPRGRERESCGIALASAGGGVHLPIAEVSPSVFLDVLGRVA
jgi:magnesium chelatase subunit D